MSGKLLKILSWIFGVGFLLLAMTAASKGSGLAAVTAGLLGLYLLPPIRSWISSKTGNKIPRGGRVAIAVGLFIVAAVPMSRMSDQLRAEQDAEAAIIQARKDSVEKVRTDSIAVYEKTRAAFIEKAGYVDEKSYDEWLSHAADSVKDPQYTVASFLATQKRVSDSTLAQKKKDSIRVTKLIEEAGREIEAKKRETQQAERAAAREKTEQTNANCTYQGHRIYQGPRGGCYYMVGGEKKYVPELSCNGC